MNANKVMAAAGIFLMVFFFQAAPSFGAAVTGLDPSGPGSDDPTTNAVSEDPPVEALLAGECSCNDSWKNHGEYVSCISRAVKELHKDKLITEDIAAAIISAKKKGTCGDSI